MKQFSFPRWMDRARALTGIALVIIPLYGAGLLWYAGSLKTTGIGYMPKQPIPFSHALHVGELKTDCRYCHAEVEHAALATFPTTETCMSCHQSIRTASSKLLKLREAWLSGKAIPWVKVYDLPDYVYFNHSAHVNRGVGCVSCHGQVDQLTEIQQVQPLTMGWCLDCHRAPEAHLRPPEEMTNMRYRAPDATIAFGKQLRLQHSISPSVDCSTCHR